jgi:dihydroflavonol-4-reductase
MKVGVTGITGFLGSNVGKALLGRGNYFLRGSVRSLNNSQKVDPIREAYSQQETNYELVEADLNDRDSIFEFAKGLDYIIHVASPVPNVSKKTKEEDLYKPAIEGTLNVLKAANEHGVKKVICTSSVATISDPHGWKLMYSHEDHVDADSVTLPYTRSKIYAEENAWEYIKELKESNENSLEMSTIHPALIVGPTFAKDLEFLSMTFIRDLANGKYPMVPHISFGITDVRDWAEAHIDAIEAPSGNRFVTAGETLFIGEIGQIIFEEFGDKGLKASTKTMPRLVGKLASYVNPYIKNNFGRWGKKIKYDSSLAEKHLNFNPRPARESIIDMVNSLIERGYIKSK